MSKTVCWNKKKIAKQIRVCCFLDSFVIWSSIFLFGLKIVKLRRKVSFFYIATKEKRYSKCSLNLCLDQFQGKLTFGRTFKLSANSKGVTKLIFCTVLVEVGPNNTAARLLLSVLWEGEQCTAFSTWQRDVRIFLGNASVLYCGTSISSKCFLKSAYVLFNEKTI